MLSGTLHCCACPWHMGQSKFDEASNQHRSQGASQQSVCVCVCVHVTVCIHLIYNPLCVCMECVMESHKEAPGPRLY